jgi:hypothetical protein
MANKIDNQEVFYMKHASAGLVGPHEEIFSRGLSVPKPAAGYLMTNLLR